MELIRYIHNLKQQHQGCVATIGNFDGVHLGHQAVIAQLRAQAQRLALPAVVMIFEPQPLEYFSPDTAPARLSSLREKCEQFAAQGVERVFCLRFQQSLAALPAERFVSEILAEGLGVKQLIVGDDFRFGKARAGNFDLLVRLGRELGFAVVPMQTRILQEARISSSSIRAALAGHELDTAAELLGRPYSISGRVVHGEKRGRELGYATANLALQRRRPPLRGIYAVRAQGLGRKALSGVASLGTRPVFAGEKLLLEVHLFDFDEEIYGAHLRVEFLHYLRREQMFASVAELKKQMQQDAQAARDFFANEKGMTADG